LFKAGEVAFDGHDLVSYHEENKPVKGNPAFAYTYQDWKLVFASQANLDKFKANPSKYVPTHKGYCSIALVKGDLVKPDYTNFKVQDGDLLFFLTKAFFNGKTLWEKDPITNHKLADENYAKIVNKQN
jgi:YHS domain-containing protein